MAMTSLNISIPEQLKAYIEARVESGDYGTPSEYVRSLVRQDKEAKLDHLKQQLLAALQTEELDITREELASSNLGVLLRSKLKKTEK
jgi:antitoxin ParD1/3/4